VEEPLLRGDQLVDPVETGVMLLLREAMRRALIDVEKEARGQGDAARTAATETTQVRLGLAELDDPALARSAADRLVVWLTERENR
jgi:hypothetical protein